MTDFTILADKALRDEILTHEESLAVLQTPDSRLLELLQAAFTVRERYFGKTVRLQMLLNAKSGACQEDCGYCSQSAISKAPIERYGLLTQDQMVTGARRAAAAKAQRYCIVISGRSPIDRDIADIASAVRSIKQEVPIQICCSLGLLNERQAKDLKAAGVDRINHNLNTSEAYHPEICTTHTFQDRLATIRHARTAGLEICSGGIVGMGESDEDLIDLARGHNGFRHLVGPYRFIHDHRQVLLDRRIRGDGLHLCIGLMGDEQRRQRQFGSDDAPLRRQLEGSPNAPPMMKLIPD